MILPVDKSSSLSRLLAFWWVLFVIVQQTERLFLFPETAALEWPTIGLLTRTLGTGLVGDMISATGAVAVAGVLGLLLAIPASRLSKTAKSNDGYRTGLNVALAVVGGLLLVILIVDVGYYGFSQQHVNFVFFEYLDDLLHTSGNETGASQAAEQTVAELEDGEKWGVWIGTFLLLEGLAIAGWWVAFKQKIGPMLARWETQRPVVASVALVTAVVSGAAGLGPFDQSWSPRTATDSEASFHLAQNPLLFAREPLRDAFLSQWSWMPRRMPGAIKFEEAVQVAQEALGRGASFPFPQYPLVKETNERVEVRFFFQAEDGIRYYKVTGVQTCALPISTYRASFSSVAVLVQRFSMAIHGRSSYSVTTDVSGGNPSGVRGTTSLVPIPGRRSRRAEASRAVATRSSGAAARCSRAPSVQSALAAPPVTYTSSFSPVQAPGFTRSRPSPPVSEWIAPVPGSSTTWKLPVCASSPAPAPPSCGGFGVPARSARAR